jgi:cell division protein FtsW (lipid II flippase)
MFKESDEARIPFRDVILEAIKGIKSEILLYGIIVAGMFISAASLGIEILRELKWPLLIIFTLALVAYFFFGAVPRAKRRLRNLIEEKGRPK